ncbi:anthranilate synthase component I [Nakamurella endophytica]|uniref:Anthranilate synthase component 1 n=2 Tax=Nakamurella endophytica TaxID=1748367 RepID=A0A917SPF3_9ACTN|nr:anthranilate synthase component I [Nakamurella endophytica]GGL90832.1 anthranilate synthase component I [Nakamurella endophytica]
MTAETSAPPAGRRPGRGRPGGADGNPGPAGGAPVVAPVGTPAPLGATVPDREDFRELARDRRVVPVSRRLLADTLTPVGLYATLAGDRPGTFLLESAEHGRSWSRWSFVGAGSPAALSERDGRAHWIGTPPAGLPTDGDALAALAETVRLLHTEPLAGLPPLTGGMVGYLGYDVVRRLERIDGAHPAVDELHVPELVMLLATDLAALDHHEGTVTLIANAVNWDATDERVDAAYDDAVARLDAMAARLARPAPIPPAVFDRPAPQVRRRTSSAEYREVVETAKEHVRAGDAFQIVLSQRFDMDTAADPLEVYRVLRTTNPSPYMYLLRLPTPDGRPVSVVGSSPEALVTVREGQVTMHPIAGTRPRGATEEDDALLAKDLLADLKERSEHVMLVDLGRNDLGRVCAAGTVRVVDFFTVERYSHVMHIVSTVTGRLAPGRTAIDALTACFPAGTLSGAPKPRAMQIIDELEPARRGIYGGIVGYLDFAGDADTAIAIRTALLAGGTAHVQAGAGIVADSVPESEDAECRNKAAAVLAAVAAAGTLHPVTGG